ncbi:hypothetical protein GCM10010922_01430 [Microbacterium sorbitolivorans]|uniref:Uncharacterized protein n=1 Tax=Microbacterium sorbitolivorans TaxID=1867410 RepID=A0A367Y7S6_9MICO|nr:hypothetical protein [Microbacterium sorbitolivorans]RCK61670.1 hypothetical protein DTO57_03320 [Microbacterium sorbitolivorans]GGF30202.1 hypothetical protein GCM10010922_01430 [Microbacterium sorbitolivorans]
MQEYKIGLSDGTECIVRPTLLDKVGAETYFRANKRFGSIADNPFRFNAVLAWSAGKRAGHFDVSFDQFLEGTNADEVHAIDVDPYEADDAPEVEGLGEDTPADPLVS